MKERKSRLGKRQQGRLLDYFVDGVTARAAASLTNVQPNTTIAFLKKLLKLIASKLPSYELSGEVEADESYFGSVRKGKRGGKKAYTAIMPNAKTETILPIIKEKVKPDSIVYTDTWRSYNALDVSDFHHKRINTQLSSRRRKTTSTESKSSGIRPSVTCANSTAFNQPASTGI